MKNNTGRKQLFPVAILKNGIVLLDGNMIYTDTRNNWIYVSEDGIHAYMYNDVTQLIRDMFKRDDDDNDYIITGWDMYPTRFNSYIDDAYNYYNARFFE
jgi:hypothetical protein